MDASLHAKYVFALKPADNQASFVSADGALRKAFNFGIGDNDRVFHQIAERSQAATEYDGGFGTVGAEAGFDLSGNFLYHLARSFSSKAKGRSSAAVQVLRTPDASAR